MWLLPAPTPQKRCGDANAVALLVCCHLYSRALSCTRLKLVSSWDHILAKHLPLPILFPSHHFSPEHPHHNHVNKSTMSDSASRDPKLGPWLLYLPPALPPTLLSSIPFFLVPSLPPTLLPSLSSFLKPVLLKAGAKTKRHQNTEPEFHWLHIFALDLGQGLLYFCIIGAFA